MISLKKAGFFAILLTICTSAHAQRAVLDVAWVDDNGVEAKRNNIASAYTTIQDGLRAVKENGTVYVLPGTYLENVNVAGGKKLIAMINARTKVNAGNDPTNKYWPVIVESEKGNAIQSFGGASNIVINGFYIRKAGGNGIHIQGTANVVYGVKPDGTINKKDKKGITVTSICNNMQVLGNRIENTDMDGIKVNMCNDVRVIGNVIHNTSQLSRKGLNELEHGIDFMLSSNVLVARNLLLDNAIGMTVKGGSTGVRVRGNNFAGPFQWVALSGEGLGPLEGAIYSTATAPKPYTVRDMLVDGNIFEGGKSHLISVRGVQNATYSNNKVGGSGSLLFSSDDTSFNDNVCIENSGTAVMKPKTGYSIPVATANCNRNFKKATVVLNTPRGIDLRPNSLAVAVK